MHVLTIAQILILLVLANGSPVIAKQILRDRFSAPLDLNKTFIDGKPIFGRSKTIRGLLISIIVTAAGAPLLGLGFQIGLLAGTTAMAGDLCSSFVKRRLGLPPSSRATGLDQIPESLVPLLACRQALSLSALDILIACVLFFVGELLLSRLLFRLRLRDRPY
jgi:CDP-diglyceride synthetase